MFAHEGNDIAPTDDLDPKLDDNDKDEESSMGSSVFAMTYDRVYPVDLLDLTEEGCFCLVNTKKGQRKSDVFS